MIEPLRFNEEICPPLAITKPVLCTYCMGNRKTRENPNVAIKYCMDCPDKFKMLYCLQCDEQFHRVGAAKNHRRRILVLGAGVRKVVKVRGDGVSFPLPLDYVTIRVRATIYHANKVIYKEKKASYLKFFAGLSGECVHIQILGAKNLVAADSGGTSDSYVVGIYSGKKLGYTRVRPKTCNPKWINETFIVPVGTHLQDPRNTPKSQRGLFRLEVYDYDLLGAHDFLGHVEIDRVKLMRIALTSKQQPILMPLTTREFHGKFTPQLGVDSTNVTVKVVSAEALDMPNPLTGCYPYVKVYFGEGSGVGCGEYLGATTYAKNTVDPQWTMSNNWASNEFRLKINEVLKCERKLLLLRTKSETRMAADLAASIAARKSRKGRGNASGGGTVQEERPLDDITKDNDPSKFVIFRFELWDYSVLLPHSPLGTVTVMVDELRKLCPQLPRRLVKERVPATRQDRIDEARRKLLNPPNGKSNLLSFLYPRHQIEKNQVIEGEDDDDFWVNNIEENTTSGCNMASTTELPSFINDDDQSVITSSTLFSRQDFEPEETNTLSAKNLASSSTALISEGPLLISVSGLTSTGAGSGAGIGDDYRVSFRKIEKSDQEHASVIDQGGCGVVEGKDAFESDGNNAAQVSPLLQNNGNGKGSARLDSLCTRIVAWITCRSQTTEDFDHILEEDPIRWGETRDYNVEQESKKNVADCKSGDRGHLVLRLIPAKRGNVLSGLDEGVRHMSLGETCDLKVRWDKAYANYCQGGNIPARSNIVFRTELLTINGWGKIYMPFRLIRRTYRFMTWSCKYFYKHMMRMFRSSKKRRICLKLCFYLNAMFCAPKGNEAEVVEEVKELVVSESTDSDDGEGEIPHPTSIKLSSRMKKLVGPAAVHGSSYLFSYKPRPVPVARRKKAKKDDEGLEAIGEDDADEDAVGTESGNSSDDGVLVPESQENWQGKELDLSFLATAPQHDDLGPSQTTARSQRPLPPQE